MLSSVGSRIVQVALAALLLTAATCRSSGPARPQATGTIELALTLPGGTIVSLVDYEITGNGIVPLRGKVNVGQSGATLSLLVDGIPAGVGYRLALTARSDDGAVTCAGEAPFDVVANATTSVFVSLQCRQAGNSGTLVVSVDPNSCPVITMMSVAPLQVGVGGTIALASSFRDADAPLNLVATWTVVPASAGTFGNPASASTSFVCASVGSHELRLTVTDGSCPVSRAARVECTPSGSGAGGAGGAGGLSGTGGGSPGVPGGRCDQCVTSLCSYSGDDTGCNNGNLPAYRRALCESLLACHRRTGCSAVTNTTCWCGTATPPVCVATEGAANGPCAAEEVAAAESTDCATVAARFTNPSYASGAVHNRITCERDLCGGVCPPGPDDGLPLPSGTGGSPGFEGCDGCVGVYCQDDGPGCESLTGERRTRCENLLACVRRTNCGAVSNSVCWCGTASPPVCSSTPGAANGPCLAEEVAAAESTDLAVISARYSNPTFASGAVHNRIACERDLCPGVCPPR